MILLYIFIISMANVTTLQDMDKQLSVNYRLKSEEIFNLIDNSDITGLKEKLKEKPKLNIYDNYGNTPLIKAILNKNLEIVQLLIEAKASPTLVRNSSKIYKREGEDSGKTPLMYASSIGSLDIVKYLLSNKKVKINRKNKLGYRALDFAIKNRQFDIIKYLFEHSKNRYKSSKLIKLSLEVNSLDYVKYFLKKKVKIDIEKDQLLSIVIKNEYLPALKFLLERSPQSLSNYLKSGETLLTLAVKVGNIHIIKYLIDLKVDINKPNKSGETALIIATKYSNRKTIFELLLKSKIDVNLLDKENKSAIFFAVEKDKIYLVKQLLKKSDLSIKDRYNRTIYFYATKSFQIFKLLYDKQNVSIFNKDINNKSLLEYIVEGDYKVLNLFKKELSKIDKNKNILNRVILFGNYDILETFLRNGVSPNNYISESPLWLAVKMNRLDLTYLLLFYKADKNTIINGQTIYDLAENNRSLRILYLLRNYQ